MNRDLFLAILAMDAYNREYGAGIEIAGDQLGEASIIDRVDIGVNQEKYEAWQDAGFYAIAYDVSGAGVDGLDGTVVLH